MSNFMQETQVIYTFDMYDALTPVGCFFGELKLTITMGKHLIAYQLEYEDNRATVMYPIKYADLDLMLFEVFDEMFGFNETYGCTYYDIHPAA